MPQVFCSPDSSETVTMTAVSLDDSLVLEVGLVQDRDDVEDYCPYYQN